MRTSPNELAIIKHYEGCKFNAYHCPAGIPTIGYGHTLGVKMGDVITQDQADAFLVDDLIHFEILVNSLKLNINQDQFDVLIDFCYNIGYGELKTSSFLQHVKSKASNSIICASLNEWVHGGGKVLPGLVKRRKTDGILFTTGKLELL